jgi:anti-sigma B factor antagonist
MSTSEPFSVRSERQGRIHRLTPLGELDIATVPLLRDEFDAVLEDGSAEMIVIDLTKLAFIDSTGLHLLTEINEVCAPTDRLRIINGTRQVVRLLDISGVRPFLPIINSADDPLAPLP